MREHWTLVGAGAENEQYNILTMTSFPTTGSRALAEEVFIISDLHIGGEYGNAPNQRGFRINTHVKELIGFLMEVRERAMNRRRRTELVINGDFVDFLAEGGPEGTDWHAFLESEEEAITRLDNIVRRDAEFFEAVSSLIEAGIAVTLLLGNHDIELSVPPVRERLREHLRANRRSGFQFIYDGEAYVIGDTMIEHGNRYDGFNVVDYDVLRRYRSESSRRLPMSLDATFVPPAGSRLVEQVMNPIKEEYGFIDLLKPETEAAIPLLLALEPTLAKDVDRIRTVMQLHAEAQSRNPIVAATPAQPGNIRASATNPKPRETLQQLLTRHIGASAGSRLMDLVNDAERQSRRDEQQIAAGKIGRALSFLRILLFTKEWEERLALLLDGFRQIQNAKLSDWSIEPEACYREAAEKLARGGFRNVVFGHTHSAKNVELADGARYLNTGAWADRMRLPPAVFSESLEHALDSLREFAIAIKNKQFEAYVEFLPTFAHIRTDREGRCLPGTVRHYEAGLVKDL